MPTKPHGTVDNEEEEDQGKETKDVQECWWRFILEFIKKHVPLIKGIRAQARSRRIITITFSTFSQQGPLN